jgi:hypothetical protein
MEISRSRSDLSDQVEWPNPMTDRKAPPAPPHPDDPSRRPLPKTPELSHVFAKNLEEADAIKRDAASRRERLRGALRGPTAKFRL